MRSTLILGLGNPILTDDGVGIRVVQGVRASFEPPAGADSFAFAEASVGGVRLLDLLVGHDRAILVDAIQTQGGRTGDITRLGVGELRSTLHSDSTHDLTLPGALAFGRAMGMKLPEDAAITIVAIEVEEVLTFGEGCTPEVEAAIPMAVQYVKELLRAHEGGRRGT